MLTLPPLSHAGELKPLVELMVQDLADCRAAIWVGEADVGLSASANSTTMDDLGDSPGAVEFFHRFQATLPDWITQPAEMRWQNALLAWPKARAEGMMWLHLLGARLDVGGKLWVYGHNRGGIKSADRALAEVFGNAEVLASKAHGRLLQAVKTAPIGRGALADWAEAVTMTIPSLAVSPLAVSPLAADASQPANPPASQAAPQQLTLTSYPGCFAHGRLDAGTAFLLAHLPAFEANQRVLDYGSGVGVIAAALRARQPKQRLTLIDIDSLALHAAAANLPDGHGLASASLLHGDRLDALDLHQRFDAIVSNPPIHQGAAQNMDVLARLIADAPRFLSPGGALYLVMQHRLNLTPLLQTRFEHVELLASNDQYKLWRAR
ncbi:MAG: methyltransferase [Holosporaceae bacterium]|jgi:16S rRNA (guanine1207-N2)-methyltransferase